MGSDVVEPKLPPKLATRSLDAFPQPPLETSQARARRSLAAAAAARNGIATMVDALRVSKPPRAPQNSRRHALIPLAEGRQELEGRIRALEDIVAIRDDEAQKLKRQLGRALVKRRFLERERESNSTKLTACMAAIKECYSALVSARADLANLVHDVNSSLPVLKDTEDKKSQSALEDIVSALEIARAKLAELPTEPVIDTQPAASVVLGKVRPVRTGSTAGSDDDAKSCASYASSIAFGDDRETQVETLIELIELLDAKLSTDHPGEAVLARAKRTVAKEKDDANEVRAERDQLQDALNAVTADGELGAMRAAKVKAEAELRYTKKKMNEMRQRLSAVEKIAERTVKMEDTAARNQALEAELIAAKKTVGRLVQERNSLRKTATFTNTPNSISSRAGRNNSEAMKRILDWRRRASNENHAPPQPRQPLFDDAEEADASIRQDNNDLEVLHRKEMLPDRVTTDLSRKTLVRRQKMPATETDRISVNDNNSLSESLDVGVNDSTSAQSLPVQGFLRRHDSFLSAGGISALGDEITITNNRNIFSSRVIHTDGLRGLLNSK